MSVFSREWLLSDTPASRRQASLGNLFLAWLAFRRNPIGMIGLGIVLALIVVSVLAPWLAPSDGITANTAIRLRPPSPEHWLGTDELGRDILSRVIRGAPITLTIVTAVALTVGPIGLMVGCIAGYFGGWVDRILMRITDVFMAFPRLVLALAFVSALKPGLENAIIAIILTGWPPYARIARAETQTIRNSDYVAAVKQLGASDFRIILRHVVPMCLSSVIVRGTLDMAGVILTAAGLGFLGLGAQPPLPEWGAMISSGRRFLLDQWWVGTFPGIAICVVSLGFNLLGDGLREVLDPKQR